MFGNKKHKKLYKKEEVPLYDIQYTNNTYTYNILCITESFNINISHQLSETTVTFVNSQH